MTRSGVLLAVCCLAGICGAAPPVVQRQDASYSARHPAGLRRSSRADGWLRLLSEYVAESGVGAHDDADWFPRPVPITLPLGGGRTLPVLILPVPVPAPTSAHTRTGECSSERHASSLPEESSTVAARAMDAPPPGPGPHRGAPSPPPFDPLEEYAEEPTVPYLDDIVSSQQLVELFRAQVAPHPELPPVVIPDYTAGEEAPEPEPAERTVEGYPEESAGGGAAVPAAFRHTRQVFIKRYRQGAPFQPEPATAAAPLPPRFDRSLVLRAELTVPRSGYTEPYTVWWEPRTGAARVDLHGGATAAYRLPLPDGRVQAVSMYVDRSGDGDVRRCALAAPRRASSDDRHPPGVPDLQDFSFAGYFDTENGRVERWTRTLSGDSGQLGAVRGEALTFRHEVVLARAPDNITATPLKYSVGVDSSVLGRDCDGYTHRYLELREQPHDPATFTLDPAEACEELERDAPRDRVEPLREYTLPHRDPRYDADYQRFKSEHRRRYLDDAEQAVRKTVLVQHSRFVDSGNRQGPTFRMKVNYLGDRLDAESARLGGVQEAAESLPAERFPHSREQLAAMRHTLPRAFDWRDRGGVTHVRFQGVSCNSCWAFAVTAAVEGALFVKTRRLVPLSEQSIVDCAHPYGGHGCGRTWPSAAYDYAQERGLPALADYTAYQAKVLTCKDAQVPQVTRISAHVNVTANNVQALKVAIRRHAPTVVLIYSQAKSFLFYQKGVLYDDRCPKNVAEHAVTAVGWGERRGETHVVVKNSWSDRWGEAGYARLQAPANTCGVLARPSYPRLERPDVLHVPADAARA